MTAKPARRPAPASSLRARAEAAMPADPPHPGRMSPEEVRHLIHDLQVHQIELEMQNEELRQTQAELAVSRDRFNELYDFTPVGCLTIGEDTTIHEANLTAATLLGLERGRLVGAKFTRFVSPGSLEALEDHRRAVVAGGRRESCELFLRRADGTTFPVQLDTVHVENQAAGRHFCRCALTDISRRKQAEAALRRSEEFYRSLYENNLDAVFMVDTNGRFSEVNPAAVRLSGYSVEELRQRNFADLCAPDQLDATLAAFQQGLAGRSLGMEAAMICKHGRRVELLVTGAPVVIDGQFQGMFCIAKDVTERREFIHQLQQFNETLEQRVAEQTREVRLLAEAVSHLAEGVMITADHLDWPEPRILFVNDAMCRITGYTAAELIGQTPRLLQGERTDRAVLDRIRDELHSGRPCEAELINYRKNGEPYVAEVFITPLLDADGRRVNFVSVHRDITERRLAEEALMGLGRIVEESLNEIYIFDADSLEFLQVNRGARANLGYTMEELKKLTPLDLKPADTREQFNALLEPLRSGAKGRVVLAAKFRRKEGTYYDVEVHIQMSNHRGSPCFVAIVHDTTRQRELEQEVVNAAEEERHRIAHDLHDDLGALLTGVKLRAEALGGRLSDQGSEFAEGVAIVAELIRDAISKTRGIARGLHPVGFDPEDLMGALRSLRQRVGGTRRLRCRFFCPKPVLIDGPEVANHLFRIAQEAVTNATKYSGGTYITISLKQADGTIKLAISDNGTGFDQHEDHGTGLGLHIMNYRANAINGRLQFKRRRQGGTTVVCTVPIESIKSRAGGVRRVPVPR